MSLLINHMVCWLDDESLLAQLGAAGTVQRVSLYADDLVLFVEPNDQDLRVLKLTLQTFGLASGLFANLDKSMATPMHCSEDDIARVQQILSCQVEGFPGRYLGIPLSIFRLKKGEEQALIDAIAARIPLWKGNLLNIAGRMTLVKCTLSAIPVQMAIALCLSLWAIECIDKLCRAFIWYGAALVSGGHCKVAWETVCRPHDLGGLGLSDLRRTGVALRVRWPWLRRADQQRTWQALHSDERAVMDFFRAATVSNLGNGESMLFWTYNWLQGSNIRCLAPAVFTPVPKSKRGVTMAEALHGRTWVHHVTGPHTMRLLMEFIGLCNTLEQVQLSPVVLDTYAWRLMAGQQYSVSSAYGAMFVGCSKPLGARQL